MSGERQDPEQVIRDWLADAAPNRAPASLRETLEEVTLQPAGNARPARQAAMPRIRLAGSLAAAVAVLAIATSSIYLINGNRGTAPEASSSTSSWSGPESTASFGSPTASSSGPTQLAPSGSSGATSWRFASSAFQLKADFADNRNPIFALPSGGFVAFFQDQSVASAGPRARSGALGAPQSAAPSQPTRSWPTVAAWSSDGSTWTQQSDLLSKDATVSAVSQSGGLIVAVGWTGDVTNATAMAWSTSDLRTWHATKLPAPADTTAYGIAVGPAGFLAWGFGETSTELWLSTDGIAWRALATTGLWAMGIDELYAVPGGYAIRGSLSDRSAVWQSSDGATWTQAWTGPGPSGMEGYSLGPISKAPAGGYVSFGTAYMAPGGPATVPYDLLVWTSSDMIHWTLAKRIARPGWMDGFAAIPGGYVAAGAQPAAGDAGVVSWGSLAVWTSSDGLSWQRLADISVDGPIEVLSVVSDGKHAIVSILNKAGSTALLVGNGLQ